MPKLLEVIVTSVAEAKEAELGGADRLEVVRSLENGGLTPPLALVHQIVQSVSIPVRVMLRENASMSIGSDTELKTLELRATELARLSIEGVVIGFVANGRVDLDATHRILACLPDYRCTFHRAFEHVDDPLAAICELKQIPQVDRILTNGGDRSEPERVKQLVEWQRAAAPEIRILAGVGVCPSFLAAIAEEPSLLEIHVGRAARSPHTTQGGVNRIQVSSVKSALL